MKFAGKCFQHHFKLELRNSIKAVMLSKTKIFINRLQSAVIAYSVFQSIWQKEVNFDANIWLDEVNINEMSIRLTTWTFQKNANIILVIIVRNHTRNETFCPTASINTICRNVQKSAGQLVCYMKRRR